MTEKVEPAIRPEVVERLVAWYGEVAADEDPNSRTWVEGLAIQLEFSPPPTDAECEHADRTWQSERAVEIIEERRESLAELGIDVDRFLPPSKRWHLSIVRDTQDGTEGSR